MNFIFFEVTICSYFEVVGQVLKLIFNAINAFLDVFFTGKKSELNSNNLEY